MNAKPIVWLMLCTALAVAACERTTSVGALGAHRDAASADGAPDADSAVPSAATLCTSSGGVVTTGTCCASDVASFPDTCAIGACGCAPASSRTVTMCSCPAGCFRSGMGCVAP